MTRASEKVHPDRWPRRSAVTTLHGGVFAAVLLIAVATAAQAPQRQGSDPLATVRLGVEGMVCYG